jgi:hypothetical protein
LKLKIQTETNDEMKRWKQKQEQSIKQVWEFEKAKSLKQWPTYLCKNGLSSVNRLQKPKICLQRIYNAKEYEQKEVKIIQHSLNKCNTNIQMLCLFQSVKSFYLPQIYK